MIRKHKTYSRPKRPFEKERILAEAVTKEEFGLKNKKEIWKAEARVKELRNKAKNLISDPEADQKAFFERLNKMGLKVNSIGEVLSLDKKDYLNRRIQTILVQKKLAPTIKAARQLIAHKKVIVGDKIVDSPSYIVNVNVEDKIKIKEKKVKPKKIEEVKE
jgi:small subunit ribosomal protein S4